MRMLNDTNSGILVFTNDSVFGENESKKIFEKCISILYSKDYSIFPLLFVTENKTIDSVLAYSIQKSNDDLRKDAIYLLDIFQKENIILKYQKETNAVKLFNDGSETLCEIISTNRNDEVDNFFIHEGTRFSFKDMPRYYFPKQFSDLKNGMIVEYLNNEKKWVEKPILDLETEYDKLFKLLIKYQKLRILVN